MDAQTRQRVVAEALSWQGTPYAHNQATKGRAADCALFPLAVYQAAGVLGTVDVPRYSAQWYLHKDEEIYLQKVIELGGVETAALEPGNFIIWRIGRTYSHGGIILAWPGIIHALARQSVIQADATNDGIVSRKPYKVFEL
jgi:cell wall-associated NlpC family hydrolase